MTARPILFSGPMVRALLKDRKTQTRRVVKPQPSTHHWQKSPGYIGDYRHEGDNLWHFAHRIPQNPTWDRDRQIKCPYGKPGDLLWVRETWCHTGHGVWTIATARMASSGRPIYRAEGERIEVKWWPAIHMPREFSRLSLRITDVRVQRLAEISAADAWAEGVTMSPDADPRHDFSRLWQSINGPESWYANPWVWALTFEVIKQNIGTIES